MKIYRFIIAKKRNIKTPFFKAPYCSKGFHSKHRAFTLAETFITLTIVGIVAAITIPTLISNYQDRVMDVALKKAYNNVKSTMTIMQLKYGNNFLLERYPSHSFAEDFGLSINAREIKSTGTYSYKIKNPANAYFNCGDRMGDGYVKDANFTYMFRKAYAGSPHYFANIYVDLNGDKAPNRIGYDVFPFVFNTKTFNKTNIIMKSQCLSVADIEKKSPSTCSCDFTRTDAYNEAWGCTAIALNDPKYWKYIKKFK